MLPAERRDIMSKKKNTRREIKSPYNTSKNENTVSEKLIKIRIINDLCVTLHKTTDLWVKEFVEDDNINLDELAHTSILYERGEITQFDMFDCFLKELYGPASMELSRRFEGLTEELEFENSKARKQKEEEELWKCIDDVAHSVGEKVLWDPSTF